MTNSETTGFFQNYFMQVGAQQGWQCPVCKRVLSPWTPECPCHGQGAQTYTTVSCSSAGSKTITMHNADIETEQESYSISSDEWNKNAEK